MWLELEDSEWGLVEFSTDEDGYVTGFSVTWSPRGSSYGAKLDRWWPTTEFLPNLFLPLSPRAEDWSFPWGQAYSHKREGAVGLTLALDQVDFSRTGSRLSRRQEDLGGLTGAVEVLLSEGYQPTLAGEMRALQATITYPKNGSVTPVQEVTVREDDLNAPQTAATLPNLTATTVLHRKIAAKGNYP